MLAHLDILSALKEKELKRIKALFNRKELMALWAAYDATLFNAATFDPSVLAFGWRDYCTYKAMEASQFTDNLALFSQVVSDKLSSLNPFSCFVLIDYLKDKRNANEIFKGEEDE